LVILLSDIHDTIICIWLFLLVVVFRHHEGCELVGLGGDLLWWLILVVLILSPLREVFSVCMGSVEEAIDANIIVGAKASSGKHLKKNN
jgi:hypothetical protein